MRPIFLDGYWFVHIPFGSMVKIQSFAQFPLDHLSHPDKPGLVHFLQLFIAFAYNMINRFIFSPA